MIEINLVPPQLRKKENQGAGFLKSIDLPQEILVGLGSLFILLLILIHLSLLGFYFVKLSGLMTHKTEWQKILPDKQKVDAINQELRDLNKKLAAINEIGSKKEITWAEKLNILSDIVPKGIWFKKVNWNGSSLTIEGNAYSKSHDELSLVNSFVANLKKQQDFAKDFLSIEVASVNRIKKGPTELADFKITAKTEADKIPAPKPKKK